MSYAVWRYTFTGQTNTIETESIELELLESTNEIISITNALPMSDDQGKKQTQTFNFAVITRTTSATDISYAINIEKLIVDSGYTSLNDNQIKVYLTDYNNNTLVNPTKISDLSNYKLYTDKNTHNNTTTEIQDKYKLKVWIDKDVDASNWNENTRLQYKFKIGVNADDQVSGEQDGAEKTIYSSSVLDTIELLDNISSDESFVEKTLFYKISNATFTREDLIGATIKLYGADGNVLEEDIITEDSLSENDVLGFEMNNVFWIITKTSDGMGSSKPITPGIWMSEEVKLAVEEQGVSKITITPAN